MKRKNFPGYLVINGLGGFQDKFFTLLFKGGIRIWDIEQRQGGFSAVIRPYNYLAVKRLASESGVRVTVEKRGGLYFTIAKYNKRLGVVFGFLLMGLITTGLSNCLWDIDITGNDTISDSAVLEALYESGITIGMQTNEIDYNIVKQNAMLKLSNLGWLGMELTGCRLNIKVNEIVEIPEMIETDKPCNVVAVRDGKIVLTEIYDGTQLVEVGDGINKGGMLVSGTVVDSDGNVLYKHASAKIIAEFTETKDLYIPFESIEQSPCGDKTHREYLLLMNSTIPLFWGDGYVANAEYTEETYNKYLFGVELPYKIKVGTYTEYEDITVIRTTEQIVSELREEKSLYEKNFLSEYEIIDCREAYTMSENGITLSLFYKLRGNIAKQEKIELNFEKNAFIS